MGLIKGYGGSVSGGGSTVGEVQNWELTRTRDIVETTALGSQDATNCGTIRRWTASFTANVDVSDVGQGAVESAFESGSDLALVLYVGGTSGAGNRSYTGNCVIGEASIGNDVAGVVSVSVSVTGNGAITPADLT